MDYLKTAREALTKRLNELDTEAKRIRATLATLGGATRSASPASGGVSRKPRQPMSAEAKQAHSLRMKKIWADRRATKTSGKPDAMAPRLRTEKSTLP